MLEQIRQWTTTLLLLIIAIFMCGIFVTISMNSMNTSQDATTEANILPADNQVKAQTSVTPVPSATSQPNATATATRTLKPPPTFEPPTSTPLPSLTPTITPTQTVESDISLEGLQGIPSPTTTVSAECTPRQEWTLIHTVKRDDALSTIAQTYGTYVEELMEANCLTDKNLIVVGQQLRVPGTSPAATSAAQQVVCAEGWQVIAPHDNSFSVPSEGELTFDWRGPKADRYLVRIYKPEGGSYEVVVDLRQNVTVDLENLPIGGKYTWVVYPLDQNFQQTACKEGGPWTFTKPGAPTPTPTATSTISPLQPSFVADRQNGVAPLMVNFFNTSRGEITGYAWDFGDGTTSSESNPVHTFNAPGSYFVRMTIYGPNGTSDFSTTLIVVN